MDAEESRKKRVVIVNGFSTTSPPRIFWNSRKRSGNGRSLEKAIEEAKAIDEDEGAAIAVADSLSDRRRSLFEPLAPSGGRISNEDLLPPPDFEAVSYPKGWVVGKKRKLVNVDVVESMRRIAVQEMNRKDREIDGLSEQLEEDSRCLEHLQMQLLDERRKRADLERENSMLHDQISMLMAMLRDDADTQ
ncbi:snf1 kinase interactor-like protein [Wolffia australiana]